MFKKHSYFIFVLIFLSSFFKAHANDVKLQSTQSAFQSITSDLADAKNTTGSSTKGAKNTSNNLSYVIDMLDEISSETNDSCQGSLNEAYFTLKNVSENIGKRVCNPRKKISKKAKCISQDIIDSVSPKIEDSFTALENIYNTDTDENEISDICDGEQNTPTPIPSLSPSPSSSPTPKPSPTPAPIVSDDVGSCSSSQIIPATESLPLNSSSSLKDNNGSYDFYKYSDNYGAVFKIKNNTYVPTEIKVVLDSTDSYNINPTIPEVIYIPARSELTGFKICATSNSWRYNGYTFLYKFGSSSSIYSGDGEYYFPYKADLSFKLIQGENGTYSHLDSSLYSLDFGMPEGTEITTSRSGTVIAFKEDSNEGGPDRELYKGKANYVWILHDDGSIASYLHLKQNGALVELGQKVNPGDVIGLSGNTGHSTTPHLHFQVVMPRGFAGYDYIPIRFKGISGALQEGSSYTATPISN
jgi:murein DD-endopeptidase MepM/ murein hydrolase activator NlpD